jgi:FixJ family two-component response regulator
VREAHRLSARSAPMTPIVVLVEPDHGVRTALRFSLELEGFAIKAFDREEAIDKDDLDQSIACFILSHEPRFSNQLAHPKRRKDGSLIPVVVLATNPSRGVRAEVERARAVLIEKPLLGNGLTDTLRTIVGQARSQ